MGTISNERIISLNEGEEVTVRRASTRDETRSAGLTNLNFRNTHLSKTHAVLKYENGSFYLRDGGSTFGTVVNNNFLLEGAFVRLVTGDTVGFIVTKPSSVIAEVVSGRSDQATVPMSEFKSASLGLEFSIQVLNNAIKFIPIDVVDATESGDSTLLDDFTKDVTEASDEDAASEIVTLPIKEHIEVEDESVDDGESSDSLYNLECCPGVAGLIQRYDPPSNPSASLLSKSFEYFLDRFSPKIEKNCEGPPEADKPESTKEEFEISLDGEGDAESDQDQNNVSGEEDEIAVVNSSLEEVTSNESDEKEQKCSNYAFSEEEDSDLDVLLHEISARVSASGSRSTSDESSSDSESDSDSASEVASDFDSVSDESSLADSSNNSDATSISSDASLISDILQLEAGSDVSESDISDGLEVTPVQIGRDIYLVANSDDMEDPSSPEPDCWGRWNQRCKGRKRTFDELEEEEGEDEEDDDYEEDTFPPEKKAKKGPSAIKTIAKEVGKGLFYVLATITALGVYGGKLNDQKN